MKLKKKINNKDIFCLIPARAGSKRVPNKNIKKLNNLELFVHTIKFAKSFSFLEICFSTDSKKYKKIAEKYIKVDQLRPKKLSLDNVKTYDVFKYELNRVEKKLNKKFKYLLLLQPTVPFRKKNHLIRAFKYIKSKLVDSIVTINPVGGVHPYRMKIIKNGLTKNFSKEKKENMIPIQKLPKVYIRSGSIYMIKREAFFKYKNLLGKNVKPIIVENKFAINIDEVKDLEEAKKYF
jgi:CMP-N,N'-diacetyllegionaminic acid synthase|tara:strand:+ start:202 stop:906 length:705 start_codon:yes stop_codon:yes gene_type:complete